MGSEFTFFPKLAPELRLRIWELAIPPSRVMELDAPYGPKVRVEFNTQGAASYCDMRCTSRRNAGPPAISRVSREARQVSQEKGCFLAERLKDKPALGTFNKLGSVWFRPHHDIVHLNWHLAYAAATFVANEPNPIPVLKACAEYTRGVSIMADLVLSFWEDRPRNNRGQPWLARQDEENLRLLESLTECFACLMVVNIHVSDQEVADTSLFTTPIQLVDASDHSTVKQMHQLWQRGLSGQEGAMKDLQPKTMFDAILDQEAFQQKVLEWNENVSETWLWYRYTQSWTHITDQKQHVWDPPASLENLAPPIVNLFGRRWNSFHPWVRAELDAMPKFKPAIMFRQCTKRCFDVSPRLRSQIPGFPPVMGPPLAPRPGPGFAYQNN